jgi:hypothetical protein
MQLAIHGTIATCACIASMWMTAAAGTQSSPAPSGAKPFEIRLSQESQFCDLKSPCLVQIEITNTTDQQIMLRHTNASDWLLQDFKVLFRPSTGVGRTGDVQPKNAAHLSGRSHGSFQFRKLSPGETKVETVDIDSLFLVPAAGSYSLELDRDVPPEYGGGVVHSNTLVIAMRSQ